MATTKKVTKRDRYETLLNLDAVKADAELTAFIKHEIELLDKKNTDKKPTAKQTENEGYKAAILAYMVPGTMYQVSDFVKNVPEIVADGIVAQRVTPMVTALVKDGKLIRTEDKRKAYFSLAPNAEAEEEGE